MLFRLPIYLVSAAGLSELRFAAAFLTCFIPFRRARLIDFVKSEEDVSLSCTSASCYGRRVLFRARCGALVPSHET